MIKFKQYLNEKTFNIRRDVDIIYNKAFKKYIDAVNVKGKIKNLPPIPVMILDSSILKGKEARESHKLNPIKIIISPEDSQFYYSPLKQKIVFGFPIYQYYKFSIEHINKEPTTFKNSINTFTKDSFNRKIIYKLYKEGNVKGTIAHELSHWINDSLHNRQLTKSVKKGDLLLGKKSSRATTIEIDAQIHALKTQREIVGKATWDTWSFDDLMEFGDSLKYNQMATRRTGEDKQWQKDLLRRMEREKILGKNMKNHMRYIDKILIEKEFKKLFPNGWIQYGNNSTPFSFLFGVQKLDEISNGIKMNDYGYHKIFIERKNNTYKATLLMGGKIHLGNFYNRDSVKIGWRNKSGDPTTIEKHLITYFKKLRKVVNKYKDELQ